MWNLMYDIDEPLDETEIDSQTERVDLWLLLGRALGEGGWG